MASTVLGLATTVEAQGLNSLIGGFSFASALAWYGVVQAVIEKYVKQGPGIQAHVLAALVTTLLSILVFILLKAFVKNVEIKEPGQPLFAVTR
jgi:uncharacterized membrane protein YwzB